jgi:O-antigen ligase
MASSYAAGTLIFLLVLVGYADGIHNLLTTGRLSAPTAAATIVGFRSGLAFLMVLTHWQMASSFRFSLATIFAAATVLAFGKTAIGGVLISVTYFVWVYLRAGQVLQGISVMVGILVLTYISYDWVAQKLQDYFRQSGATLTGRSFLWLQIVDMIGDRPIIGHGYSKSLMQSIVADRMQQFGWYQKDNLGQAHNAYLDALFKTGILGLSVFLTLIYKSVNRIRRLASYVENSGVGSYAVKALTIALFLLVHSLTEGHLHMGFDFAILFSLALLAGEIQYLEQKTPRVAAS